MAEPIIFKLTIAPNQHKENHHCVTVNSKTRSFNDDFTECLYRGLTSLLAVATIEVEPFTSPTGDLSSTVTLMESDNYQDRLKAEYQQLSIRYEGLRKMLQDWDNDNLGFTPKSPRTVYEMQLKAMREYLNALEIRAAIENINLT